MLRAFVCLSLLALGAVSPAPAQDDPHAHHGSVGWVPREILEKPVTLRDGIGRVHEAVSTSSKEAQAFYDQGLAYLHSYVWIEAARSFHQALRLDPKLAMAYVGLSRAFSGLEDPAAAKAALEKAQTLAAGATEWERHRIAVRAKQLEALADLGNTAKHLEYKKVLDDALAEHMDDSELWLLRGNAEEPNAAGRGQRGGAASVAFYEAAMARSPDNFAAHHYMIHSYETIGRIPEALRHGEAYSRLASAVPHAHHMYAHDLRRVGRIEDAISSFRKANELENAYFKTENIPAHMDWHHQHNLDLLATSYQHLGQMKTAERLMREAWALPPTTEYGAFNKKELPGFLLARGRAQEALEAANTLKQSQWPLGRLAGHVYAGHALLALNRMEEGRQELAAAEKALADDKRDAVSWNRRSAEPYLEGLRGEILLRSGQKAEGSALLKEVERKIRAVPGPDAWIQALFRLGAIAQLAREAGDWELAESTARQMLEHDAAYAGTHYALALVAEHKQDWSAARREFAQAEKLWAKADPDLEELSRIRQKLALLQ